MDGILHEGRSLFDLLEPHVHRAGDVDEHAARAVDGRLEQGTGDGHAGSLLGLALACRAADSHVRKARVFHDGGDIGEVEVDKARVADQVADGLHRLAQDVIGDLKCVGEGDLLIGRVFQALVGNDDKAVDLAAQLLDALLGLRHTLTPLESERLRDDADSQHALLTRDLRHDGGRAGAGAAAHAGGDEHHVRVLERLADLVAALLGRLASDIGVRARALSVRQLLADLNLISGTRRGQCLLVRVDGDELHALDAGAHHPVDHVVAAAADTDYLDTHDVFRSRFQSKSHDLSSCHILYRKDGSLLVKSLLGLQSSLILIVLRFR